MNFMTVSRQIVTTWLMIGGVFSCSSNGITSRHLGEKKDKTSSGGAVANDDKEQGLESSQDPVAVTATNLTYEGAAPRCTSKLDLATTNEYLVNCAVVQMTKGGEILAKTLAPGLSVEWLKPIVPETSLVTVQSCTTSSKGLTQVCRVTAASNLQSIGLDFSLKLTLAKADSAPAQKILHDIVSVPYAVFPIGNIPEVPQLNSATSLAQDGGLVAEVVKMTDKLLAALKSWIQGPVSKPVAEFTMAQDAQLLACGGKLYTTSRSKVFLVDAGKFTHIAGSTNVRNGDDFSNPLRTYWSQLDSISCVLGHIFITTRMPSRIFDFDPNAWKITLFANENATASWDGKSPKSSMRLEYPASLVADANGNVYFIDGTFIRKVDASGFGSTVFDGTTEAPELYGTGTSFPALNNPSSLALDLDASGHVLGFFVLADEPVSGMSKVVVRKGLLSSELKIIAGNSADPTPDARDNQPATSISLRSAGSIVSALDAQGKSVVYISESDLDGLTGSMRGEILSVSSNGMAQVVFHPDNYNFVPKIGVPANASAAIGQGRGQMTLLGSDIYIRVSLASASDQSANILKLSSGKSSVFAGSFPLTSEPYMVAGANIANIPWIAPEDLKLGLTVNAFGSDGTLYIADNMRHRLYKQNPGERSLKLVVGSASGALAPVKFDGEVISMAVHKDPVTGKERVVYVEQGESSQIKALLIGTLTPTVIAKSPGCDVVASKRECTPTVLTTDSQGRVVFFDQNTRLIRRIKAAGVFETLAGTQTASAGTRSRVSGQTQTAGQLGLSTHVTSLAYDAAGFLLVADLGGMECAWSGCAVVNGDDVQMPFISLIAKIQPVTGDLTKALVTTIVAGAPSVGTKISANSMGLNQSLGADKFIATAPSHVAALPDGLFIFEDSGIIMLGRTVSPTSFSVTRFYGGENQDCGFNVISGATESGAPVSLGAALGRMCSGAVLNLKTYDSCKGNPSGYIYIAASQMLARTISGADGGGSVLRMEIQCKAAGVLTK
jgi:hypothetical protein